MAAAYAAESKVPLSISGLVNKELDFLELAAWA